MELVTQISVAIIAIAFVCAVYFIVQTLKVLKSTLEELRSTIGKVTTDVTQVTDEVRLIIHQTNAVTMDVREKLDTLDGLFQTVGDLGDAAHTLTSAAKQTAASIAAANQSEQLTAVSKESRAKGGKSDHKVMMAIVDGIASSLRIWKKLKA